MELQTGEEAVCDDDAGLELFRAAAGRVSND